MCFYIHFEHAEPKIAEKDIYCYKYLRKSSSKKKNKRKYLFSPYRRFKWEKGEIYDTKLETWEYTIKQGFHTCTTRKSCRKRFAYGKTYTCVIPWGSTYYYNPDEEEYVSDRLVVLKYPKFIDQLITFYYKLFNIKDDE